VAGAIALGQLADKIATLEIACHKCGYGRHGVQNLIAIYGVEIGMPEAQGQARQGDARGWKTRATKIACHAHIPQLSERGHPVGSNGSAARRAMATPISPPRSSPLLEFSHQLRHSEGEASR
jgi:hypothetical protein